MFNDRRDDLPTSEDLFAGLSRPRSAEMLAAPFTAVSKVLGRRRKHLKSFEEAARSAGSLSSYPLGLRTVEVRRIVGSVGRAAELGPDFLPVDAGRKMTTRLKRIILAMENGVEMPPLDLYKLKIDYYVLDGNHRVAAARRIGQLYLDAIVTEFIPVRDTHYTEVFMARQRFERSTGLTSVAATEREHFRRISRAIQDYHERRRIQGEPKLSLKDAAQSWYQGIYVPITDAVRHTKLPAAFPDRRAGDFFVYIEDYVEREKARGRQLDWQEALAELAGYYASRKRRFPRLSKYGRMAIHPYGHLPHDERRPREQSRRGRDKAHTEDPLGLLPPEQAEDTLALDVAAIPFLPSAGSLHERAPQLHRPTDLYVPPEEGPPSGEEPTPPPMGLL